MVRGSICMYSSRSLQICPLVRVIIREVGSMSEYERRGLVFALRRGARCASGGPRALPQRPSVQ